jgi:isopentenyl phosphate kinase
LRTSVVESIAAKLAGCGESMAIVHGAGGYGRELLCMYDDGFRCTDFYRGTILQRSLGRMTDLVSEALVAGGLRPLEVPLELAFDHSASNEDLVHGRLLEGVLELKRQPLLAGGTRWVKRGEFHICSSDLITARVAQALIARRVIWLTDVDGVEDERGKIVDVIRNFQGAELARPTQDCTGGMRDKLLFARELANSGIESVIVNGNKGDCVVEALRAEKITVGTFVPATR